MIRAIWYMKVHPPWGQRSRSRTLKYLRENMLLRRWQSKSWSRTKMRIWNFLRIYTQIRTYCKRSGKLCKRRRSLWIIRLIKVRLMGVNEGKAHRFLSKSVLNALQNSVQILHLVTHQAKNWMTQIKIQEGTPLLKKKTPHTKITRRTWQEFSKMSTEI